MGQYTQYYKKLAAHKLADIYYNERMGTIFGIAAALALAGGGAGYQFSNMADGTPDDLRAGNADQVMEELITQRGNLEQQHAALKTLTADITAASRSGGDAAAIESTRQEKVGAFQSFAKQLVTDAFLSSELSEREREDFIRGIDENIINMGDIGLEALEDKDGDVVEFSQIREIRAKVDAENPLLGNQERVIAIAEQNSEEQVSILKGTLIPAFLLAFLGSIGLGLGFGDYRRANNRPQKPTKTSGMRH
ncbi:MAG: hypothetical protein EP349_03595 [Alphaproteobacteria bacterium]|nr:MAG: hypothetical protein EP349_03595 [Alphaproteobacteria bacterium]